MPATRCGSTPTCCRRSEDLDEPAGFIDRVIGGDTSGFDSAIEQAIADLEKGDDDKPTTQGLTAQRACG